MTQQKRNKDLERLLSQLVSIETENPPGNEKKCAEFIQQWFQKRDIGSQLIHKPDSARPQVVAEIGEGKPTVVFNGHIDVVPAGNREKWDSDPYDPVVKDGKLYGRGSVDMKAGVAAAMLATEQLNEKLNLKNQSGTIRFHAVMGEETGDPGTKTLLEEGFGGDYGIVLEPTGLRTATKTKGTAWYKITISGEPSHASRPYQGTNAIANAQPIYERLAEFGQDIQERKDPLLGSAYATVTQFNAGTKENIIPESATFIVDRRILPSEDFDAVHEEMGTLLSEVRNEYDLELEWEVMQTYKPSETPPNSEVAEVFRTHSHSVAGVPHEEWGIPAATDTRNFLNDAEIEAITWGPGDIEQAHTFNEYIDLEEAATGVDILERASKELLGITSTSK